MERGKLHVRDARKLVVHLLLLGPQLLFVGQVLPFAAAAHAEMLAHRLNAHVAILHETHHLGFAIAVFFLSYFEVYHVAWHREGYENNHVVDPRQRLSFCRHVCNGDVLQYRKLFSLSCHIYNKVQRTRAVRRKNKPAFRPFLHKRPSHATPTSRPNLRYTPAKIHISFKISEYFARCLR